MLEPVSTVKKPPAISGKQRSGGLFVGKPVVPPLIKKLVVPPLIKKRTTSTVGKNRRKTRHGKPPAPFSPKKARRKVFTLTKRVVPEQNSVPDQLLFGKYQLICKLGNGGMGTVWKALDVTIDRPIAIKFFRRAPVGVGLEAHAASRVDHPNIVRVHTLEKLKSQDLSAVRGFLGADARSEVLVMELVEGESLESVTRRGVVRWTHARKLLLQILDALCALHGSGVVHGDIKPENCIVGRDWMVKVVDFGVARVASIVGTSVRGAGTPGYMPPEQYLGSDIDHRADIYSAAAMFAFLLTGDVPDPGEPPLLAQLGPEGLGQVLSKALAFSPEDRYSSAEDFALALKQLPDFTGNWKIVPASKWPLVLAVILNVVLFVVALVDFGRTGLSTDARPAVGSTQMSSPDTIPTKELTATEQERALSEDSSVLNGVEEELSRRF